MQRYVSVRLMMGAIFCLVVAGFLAVYTVSGAPAGALRRYPYLTDVVSTNATLNWATDRSGSVGTARYGKKGSESCTAHTVTATRTAISVNGVAEYQWKAQLSLQTGTQYCYRVYLGTSSPNQIDLLGSAASPSFRTQLSSKATQSYSFVVLGDWGQVDSSGLNAHQAKLMSLIASSGARFAITIGDNGYPSGTQTNYGDLIQTGSNISAIFGPSFWKVPGSSIPIFPALGNHGLSSSDVNHPALLNWPQDRAVSTSNGRYKKETYCCLDGTTSQAYPSVWYAFNAGPARFYVLQAAWPDTNIGTAASAYQVDFDYHWAPGTAQYNWLKADLAAHASALKFVFLHYPMYSDSAAQPSDTFLQGSNNAEGLFKQNGVDIVFTGHAHIYQRNRASAAGVINYVTGGGGATLGTLGICSSLDAYGIGFTTKGKACGSAPAPTSADQVYHFLKVTVNGTSVTVTPINALGQSFDVMKYSFSTSAQAPAPSPSTHLATTSVPVGPRIFEPAVTPAGTPTIAPAVTSTTCIPTNPSPTATQTVTATSTPFRTPVPQISPALTNTATGTASATPTCTPIPEVAPAVTRIVTLSPTSTNPPLPTDTPQTVTPVATVGPGGALTFISQADAHVDEASPATNFGTSPDLQSNGGTGSRQISFIRFVVSGAHDTIQDVKLRLFCATTGTTNGPAVYLADSRWIESGAGGITWNHQPQLLSSEMDNKGAIGTGTWVEYDVGSMVDGDGTYTFALIADGTDDVTFSSREGSMPPQLVMTFSP